MSQVCEVCGETRCARVDPECRVPCVSHALRHVYDVHNPYIAEWLRRHDNELLKSVEADMSSRHQWRAALAGSSQRAGHVAHSMTEHLWDCGTQFECECGWLSPFAPSKLGLLENAVAEHKSGIRHVLETTEQAANRCGFERRGPPRYSWVEARVASVTTDGDQDSPLTPISVSHELGNECRSLSVDCGGYRVSLGYAITPERRKVAPDDATRGDKSLREQIEGCCAQIRAGDRVVIAKMIADGIAVRIGTADPDGPPTPLPAPQANVERVFAAPAHDYLAALHRPYVPPV